MVFYVGKGDIKRATCTVGRTKWYTNIVKKHGAKNIIIRFFKCSSEKDAFSLEKKKIANYRKRKIKLVNFTDGGEGIAGYKFTKEVKLIISRAHKKRFAKHPNLRKVMQKRSKQIWADPKFKAKMRRVMKQHWKNPTYRNKVSAKYREAFAKPEFKKKISIARKRLWKDPKYRNKLTAKFRISNATEKARKFRSKDLKKRWKNPEFRKKILSYNNMAKARNAKDKIKKNPQYLKKLSESQKAVWKRPGYRIKMSKKLKLVWRKKLKKGRKNFRKDNVE